MPVTKTDDLPMCVATGQILVTRMLNRLFAHPAAVEEHPHWDAFKGPGHLRELDAGCVEFLGLAPSAELVGHLKHVWPSIGIDVAHQAIVNAVLDRVPVRFSWKPAKCSETSISVSDTGEELVVRIFSPVPAKITREPVVA